MEKFVLNGSFPPAQQFYMKLPSAKQFEICAVKNGESEIDMEPKHIISRAVERWKKNELYHVLPFKMKEHKRVDLPRSLQQILTRDPFPINQGPVNIPINCNTVEHFGANDKTSVGKVLASRTVFSHNDTQECMEWIPVFTGVSAWVQNDSLVKTYEVNTLKYTVQGTASTSDMGIVHTCQLLKCVIHCPCHICSDKRKTCRLQCKTEVCVECNSQCTNHELKLPGLFNADTDHFTMITNRPGKYLFAIPHAGIPLSCEHCSQDVLEHNNLHLVFHTRCRFCRHEVRPFYNTIQTIDDYKNAMKILHRTDNRTCSFCFFKCQDKYARERHEDIVHKKEISEKKFKCCLCTKSYTNKSALDYHIDRKHDSNSTSEKYSCDLCGKQFTSEGYVLTHKQLLHGDGSEKSKNECEDCGQTFSARSCLNRHITEKHYGRNVNLDYIEDLDSFSMIKCDKCDKQFKRRSHLKRHVNSVHGDDDAKNKFNCLECEIKFSRKDALARHIKSKHNAKDELL